MQNPHTLPTLTLDIPALLNDIVRFAVSSEASDIHILPTEHGASVRVRIDGALSTHLIISSGQYRGLLARIKILASLRIDEHLQPQDGRFTFRTPDATHYAIRVAIAASQFGEHIVLRILSSQDAIRTLESLGCSETQQQKILEALNDPNGMILATGPTGSGKTTLLYALLGLLDRTKESVITLEDPIEYSLEGITQIPINHTRGITFARGLRSVLRQDPDTILVGEIRDTETAQLAIQAGLTGHRILSSLHTSSAATAIPRLTDMGIETYRIYATLSLVIATRLVPKLCADCRIPSVAPASLHAILAPHVEPEELATNTFFTSTGCEACRGTGSRGRVGVFEILHRSPEDHFVQSSSLLADGIEKARVGVLSVHNLIHFAP